MKEEMVAIGIDVGADELVLSFAGSVETFNFNNEPKGHRAL